MYVHHIYACLLPKEARTAHWLFCNWSYRQLSVTWCVCWDLNSVPLEVHCTLCPLCQPSSPKLWFSAPHTQTLQFFKSDHCSEDAVEKWMETKLTLGKMSAPQRQSLHFLSCEPREQKWIRVRYELLRRGKEPESRRVGNRWDDEGEMWHEPMVHIRESITEW